MPKPVNPNADTHSVIAVAKTEPEKELVKYFKEVMARDGLQMREEIFKLIAHDWIRRHPRPGNPQKQLIQYDGSKQSEGLCEWVGCMKEAEWYCRSAFPYGRDKRYCSFHKGKAEYKRDICESRKL